MILFCFMAVLPRAPNAGDDVFRRLVIDISGVMACVFATPKNAYCCYQKTNSLL